MSNAIFPTLPGLGWSVKRTPSFKTLVNEAVSGKETRAALWSYPRYRWELTYDVLRDGALAELRTLEGFFLQRQGSFDAFLFSDPDDNAASGQPIGIGDGSTAAFQLVRPFGGFVDPVLAPNSVSAVYLGGVVQSGGAYSVDTATGLVTFTTAPAAGVAVTADFTFYWRVRFLEDVAEFEKFALALWQLKKLAFISVK
jgi:uncharacterized protein (TIGR02217 family)